jgi:mono/diheme cytochrome c family protein
MHNQNKVLPLRKSDFFADGQSARPLPAGTVARGGPGEKIAPYTGLTISRQTLPAGPPPVTLALLHRGQERFNIFCSPCHDRTGSGNGMIVQRGFKRPTSYHTDRLRSMPVDYFYQVMTEGYGVMPSYAPQVPPEDRWAIAAYIRALQVSQNAHLAELPADVRQAVEREQP